MELDKIKIILDKYFEGETSISEENELKDYFSTSDVAPELQQYKSLFGYYSQAKKEEYNAEIVLRPQKRNYITWISIAATIMMMLGLVFYINTTSNVVQDNDLGTFDNPELAFKETQKALDLLSTHVNTGIESMNYINQYEQSKNKIFK